MRHEVVKVKRDNNTVHSLTVAPWEVPVLEYLFGEGNVEPQGQFVDAPGRDYPDARDEMGRLQKAYGADVKTDVPHVVSVYGTARVGVKALAKAIDAARGEEDEEGQAPSGTTGARVTKRRKPAIPQRTVAPRPHASDSLLA
jgi:hypothetical protein